jgi:nucleoside-diphosphate-sugar epimerase
MVHVYDVAKTLVNSLEYADKGVVFDHPIEIGPSEHNTVRSVAEIIIEIVKELTDIESEILFSPMRPGEIAGDRVIAKNSTLELVGIDRNSLIPLKKGMEETVKWFMENQGNTWNEI